MHAHLLNRLARAPLPFVYLSFFLSAPEFGQVSTTRSQGVNKKSKGKFETHLEKDER